MSARRVYVDVDGVLNAVTSSPPAWGWGAHSDAVVNGFPIRWSPELVEVLNEVTAAPGVEAYWLTTWEHDAPKMLAPAIGLKGEDWPVVGTEHHYSLELQNGWWKLVALRDHLGDFDGPVLWLDDDIRFDPVARRWLAEAPNVTAMSPRTELGITRRQARIIRDWTTTPTTEALRAPESRQA